MWGLPDLLYFEVCARAYEMINALWGFLQSIQKLVKYSLAPQGRLRVLTILADWPLGSRNPHRGGNICETRARSQRPPGEVSCDPMENEESMK